MPTALMTAYETLQAEDQKLVEQLIYSLVAKVKNQKTTNELQETEEQLLSDLQSLRGILSDCEYSSIQEARKERLSERYGV